MISRLLKDKLLKSPKSILILGPRQVGKSTLIESLGPDLTINLGDEKTFLSFKSNPNEIYERIDGVPDIKSIFIDEVQLHPLLLNTLQVLLDSKEYKNKLKIYISGSSARKLKRGQANLLPGRIFSYELGPLSAAELNYKININRSLKYGFLPEPYLNNQDDVSEKLLSTYSGTYLKEEIQAESLTRNLEGFSRFLMVAAENAGHILDFSKIAKEARIERKNCSRFFEILEDTLIATKLDVYSKSDADITKRPKFYFFDVGVLNGLLQNFNVSNDRKGMMFEHIVINQIQSSAKAHDIPIQLFYFRTRSGFEVDLILEMKGKTYAIEIKSGNLDSRDALNLLKIKNYIPSINETFIVGLNTENKGIKGVKIRNLTSFLKEIGL